MDLRNWDPATDGTVNLIGEYLFFWRQFRSPQLLPARGDSLSVIWVPGDWNGMPWGEKRLGGKGFATYQLLVKLSQPPQAPLAIKVYDVATAFRLFVNGDTLLTIGHPATSAAGSIPAYHPQIVEFFPRSEMLNLVIHVSNFHHRRGGIWDVVRLGDAATIRREQEWTVFADFFLLGSIIIMGLYHCGLYILDRKNRAPLYLGLFCFSIGLRLCTTEEIYLLHIFPNISWQNLVRLEYLSLYALVPIFALFLFSLFPREFKKRFVWAMFVISGICIALVLFFSVAVFSYTSPVYQVFLIISMLYGFYVLVKGVRQKKEGAGVILAGFVVLFLTAINDILNVNSILYNGELAALGLFIFILIQAFYLARRFSIALATVEDQREKLARTNRRYIAELQERRRAEKEKMALQERVSRSEKLEMLGRLASTVAHELNNILAVMVIYPDMIEADLPRKSSLHRPLSQIKIAALNASAIIQDLLTLARRGRTAIKPVNLNDLIVDFLAAPEFEYLMQYHPEVKVETQLAAALPNIDGSEIHLRNAILNLVKNAAEAQPKGGLILISTNRLQLSEPDAGKLGIPPGHYVVLHIKDQGEGIAPADRPHIFEPFYSTKEGSGSGTGLGMAVVWATVNDHQGHIKIDSSPDRGTTFTLYFPEPARQMSAGDFDQEAETPAEVFEKYRGNGEKILVIEEMPMQQRMMREVLQRLGYSVETVDCEKAAIEFLQHYPVDLIVLNVATSAGWDGVALYGKIRAIRRGARVVAVSSGTGSELFEQLQQQGVRQCLRKPFTVEKLARAIKTEFATENL